MIIRFSSPIKKNWFILFFFYFLIIILSIYFLELRFSSLGDHLHYSSGNFYQNYSSENLTINIYSIFSLFGIKPIFLGFLIILYISYFFVNNIKLNLINIFILLTILNPFVLQFLIYASKELLLVGFAILAYRFRKYFLITIFIILILFLIRPIFFFCISNFICNQ